MTIEDVHAYAWQLMTKASPKINAPNPDAAIYKYWAAHRDFGPPMSNEFALHDGTTAQVFATGRVLHWLGGDSVEEAL